MKKGVLLILFTTLFLPTYAGSLDAIKEEFHGTSRYENSIIFIERGIKFHVFLNGDFDFNTNYRNTRYTDYYNRRNRISRGVPIERDYNGNIRRVGNVFINYDFRGNVTRIGNTFITYRRGKIVRVGGLFVRYDRWGRIFFDGHVKNNPNYYDQNMCYDDINVDITIGDIYAYDDLYFFRNEFRNNYRQYKEDQNFYYYRAAPNAQIGKRSKIIKRRKNKSNDFRSKRSKTPINRGRR